MAEKERGSWDCLVCGKVTSADPSWMMPGSGNSVHWSCAERAVNAHGALVEAVRGDLTIFNTLDIIAKAGIALRVDWSEIGKSVRERIIAIDNALKLTRG